MSTLSRTVRLASEDLSAHRHVCVLVDGPAEADALLMPFITDGLDRGDRAVHVVDPESREAHIERLTAGGVDVPAAMATGQLEVKTWTDVYLRGGRFDGSAQLAYLREMLGEGRALGYPLTRYIGSTEWALEADTVRDLLSYEAGVDGLLRGAPDVLVCTYDLNHHAARTVAEVLGIHAVALVGGRLRTGRGPVGESARDRLLTAASQLFQAAGIQATGVDSLIAAAGVAKATFYRHFPSKDDLVIAWLNDPRTRWLDEVRARAEADGADAPEVIPRLFEALANWMEREDYRGCPYLNTAIEIREPTHPARKAVVAYLQEVEDYLFGLVEAAGYREPRILAAELQALFAGSISLAVAGRTRAVFLTAQDAAMTVLGEAARE
jgi:AcrR family transcriptional regulator